MRRDGVESVVTVNAALVRDDLSGPPGSLLTPGDRKHLVIACGEGALELLNVTPSGRKPMPAADFLNGLRGGEIVFLSGAVPEDKTF